MCTLSGLAIFSFKRFVQDIKMLKRLGEIYLDVPYLTFPEWQTLQVFGPLYAHIIEEARDEMIKLEYYPTEIDKVTRAIEWMKRPIPADQLTFMRANFFRFFTEMDRRRGTSILTTFPEITEFWKECEHCNHQYPTSRQ
jgi:hypothetical protein